MKTRTVLAWLFFGPPLVVFLVSVIGVFVYMVRSMWVEEGPFVAIASFWTLAAFLGALMWMDRDGSGMV